MFAKDETQGQNIRFKNLIESWNISIMSAPPPPPQNSNLYAVEFDGTITKWLWTRHLCYARDSYQSKLDSVLALLWTICLAWRVYSYVAWVPYS